MALASALLLFLRLLPETDDQQVQSHFRGHAAAFESGIGCQELAVSSFELSGSKFADLLSGFGSYEGSHAKRGSNLGRAHAFLSQLFDEQK